MSIADKITSIETHLQADWESIENIGGTAEDKNIENIASVVNEIYDNIPKTTGESSNLSLTTIKGKMNITPKGDTQQTTTNGYQLIDLKDGTYTKYSLTAVVSNGKVTINGNTDVVAIIEIDLNNTLTLTNGQNYTLYGFNTTTNSEVAFRPIGDYGAFQIDFSTTNNKVTRTFGNTTTTLNKIGIRVGGGTSVSNLVCSPMLISGSDTSKSYEPYTNGASPNPTYPQNIEVVTGTQEVKVENVNLWYSSEYNDTTRDLNVKFNNNKVVLNGTSSGGVDIRVVDVGNNWNTYSQAILNRLNAENTTYCGSNNSNLDVYFYMTNGTYAKTTTTTTDSIKINSIFVRVPTSTSFTNKDIEFRIEKGSTATTYTPHQEQTQVVELSSKNLYDISKVTTTNTTNWTISISGNTLSITHNNSYNTGYPTLELGKLKNGTYVLSGTLGSGIGLYKDSTYQSILNSGSTFTCNGNEDIKLTFPTASFPSGTTLTYVNMQLEKGSTPTTYEQYYNIELCKIGNYQDYLYKTSGKNLFDGQLEQGTFTNETGAKVNDNSIYRSKNTTPVSPSTTYTLSINGESQKFCLYYYDSNNNFISWTSSLTTGTFTTPNNCHYINFRCFMTFYTSDFANLKIQLELGTTATTYEPYGSGNWYIEKNIGSYTFTGSETGNLMNNNDTTYLFNITQKVIDIENNSTNYYNNYSTAGSTTAASGNTNLGSYFYNGTFRLRVPSSIATTYTEFQTWLSTANCIVYYPLTTPTYTQITNTTLIEQLDNLQKLKSYNGVTNINCSGNLSAILSVSALKGE